MFFRTFWSGCVAEAVSLLAPRVSAVSPEGGRAGGWGLSCSDICAYAPFCALMHLPGGGGGVGSACGSFAGLAVSPSLSPMLGMRAGRMEGQSGAAPPPSPAGALGKTLLSTLPPSLPERGSPRGFGRVCSFPSLFLPPATTLRCARQLRGPALSLLCLSLSSRPLPPGRAGAPGALSPRLVFLFSD